MTQSLPPTIPPQATGNRSTKAQLMPANDCGAETIGQRLCRIRTALKLTAGECAERLSVTEGCYASWERGEVEPPLMLFHWMRAAFGARVARDLIAEDREPAAAHGRESFSLSDMQTIDDRIQGMADAEGLPLLGAHSFALARMVQGPLYDRESRFRLVALALRVGASSHYLKLFPPQYASSTAKLFG
jgi:transcriptional regulator with XRE-family HTH domain